jgi:arylsulfatase A-like enzyme
MHAQESRLPHDERKLQRLKASYYGLISEVDDNLGRLFAALRTQGLWQDTLIIFTADHGEQLGDHWLLGKGGYFDQSYHVPLIIRDPASARRGTRVDAFTEHVDLMPTLLDRLALDIPPQCDGRSLRPFLESSPMPADWRREVHWEYDFRDLPGIDALLGLPSNACNLCVIRDARFKYVHFAGLAPLLFDLESDPSELVDCSTDPAHASVMIEYTQRMLSWRLRHTDQSLTHLRLGPSDVRQ